MTAAERRALLQQLEARFTAHTARHASVVWTAVEALLVKKPALLDAVQRLSLIHI